MGKAGQTQKDNPKIKSSFARDEDIFFYANPTSVSSHNEVLSEQAEEKRAKALYEISPDYRILVEESRHAFVRKRPSILDHNIRKQILDANVSHKPVFLIAVTVLQTVILAVSYIIGFYRVGLPDNFSSMMSVNSWALVSMGARFHPCMRESTMNDYTREIGNLCQAGMTRYIESLSLPENQRNICTLESVCGSFPQAIPNQIYRFVMPIFLHTGIFHFLFNVIIFQCSVGFDVERNIGSLKMAFVYMVSGIGGFMFDPYPVEINGAKYHISAGASGALYGIISCVCIELVFNWKLLHHPKIELAKLLSQVMLSLFAGYFFFIDNYAHFGGMIVGFLTSVMVLPVINFGGWDRIGKYLLKIITIPLLIAYLVGTYIAFRQEFYYCKWCWYMRCMDVLSWCKRVE